MDDLRSPYELERRDDPDAAYRDDQWAEHLESKPRRRPLVKCRVCGYHYDRTQMSTDRECLNRERCERNLWQQADYKEQLS